MKPHESHRSKAPKELRVEVVTVSTSRHGKMTSGESVSDESGDVAEEESAKAGWRVAKRSLVPDEEPALKEVAERFLSGEEDVLLLTGGTGLAKRDVTIEVMTKFFEKEIEGFGELLRRKSYSKIGPASALTRATAGVVKGKLIICMPGSPDAVRTALRSFAGEVPHALYVARS